MHDDFSSLPIIGVAPLATGGVEKQLTAAKIDAACRQSGFFYVTGHGIDAGLAAATASIGSRVLRTPDRREDAD
jgi:polar amino acid transport system ATP-binding protein